MKNIIYIFILVVGAHCLQAQPVLVEEMVEAKGLICFPIYGDSNVYKYLPSRGRLSVSEDGTPEFSFLQYAIAREESKVTGSSVTEADGGGLVHFLVLYDTPENQVRTAERELQRKLKNPNIIITGPVNISSGKFLLISSLLIDGKEQKELLGTGVAPVFQNSKVAFSFLVEPLKAKLLMESFKMVTPDISITFDLEFEGLTSAYNGKLVVDWSQVQKAEYINQSIDAIFYSKDVEKTFGELEQNGGIKMESYGKDSIASDLLSVAYDRLLDLMFNPVRPDSIPSESTGGFLDDIFGNRGIAGSLIGGSDVYKKRVIKTSGKTEVQINSRKMVSRHHFVTFNIGDLYKNYGDNNRVFRRVAIDDPTFQQREVLVNLDGSIKDEFEKMINSVSVTLVKKHQNGEETVREVFMSKDLLKDYSGTSKMIYLNKMDQDRNAWLNYNYRLNWQFQKDGNYVTDLMPSNSPIINLYPPYTYRSIDLIGDLAGLEEAGIVAVAVSIEYPFFGKEKKERITIRTNKPAEEYQLEAILPRNVEKVKYKIAWIYKDGKKLEKSGEDEYGVIIIDEVPNG